MRWNTGRTKASVARRLIIAAAVWASGSLQTTNIRAQVDIQDLVRDSPFIFRGTIRQTNAATMPQVRVSDRTAVVAVEEVLQAPARLGDYTGKTITVLLSKPVADERQLIFFTTSWFYGTGLAVREVGRLEARDASGIRDRIAEAERKVADEKLQERIRQAEVVVLGRVTAVGPLEPKRPPLSEHDPLWWKASVKVQSVEKGQQVGPTVVVLFPSSTDAMWYRSPRFKPGQEGIWILDRDVLNQFGLDGLTALDPLDFQPKDQLDRIRRLIRGIG